MIGATFFGGSIAACSPKKEAFLSYLAVSDRMWLSQAVKMPCAVGCSGASAGFAEVPVINEFATGVRFLTAVLLCSLRLRTFC